MGAIFRYARVWRGSPGLWCWEVLGVSAPVRGDGFTAMTDDPAPHESSSQDVVGMAGIEAFGLFPLRVDSVRIARYD